MKQVLRFNKVIKLIIIAGDLCIPQIRNRPHKMTQRSKR